MGSMLCKLLDKLYAPRTGHASCLCGAVRIELFTPGSSFALSEQTSCYCHCKDCVGFVRACCSSSNGNKKCKDVTISKDMLEEKLMHNNSTNLITFYKSDIKKVIGQEYIGVCKVREDGFMARTYCTECRTALGGEGIQLPLAFLYGDVLHGPYPIFPSTTVLYTSSDECTDTRPYSTSTHAHKTVPISFLFHFIRRVLIGFVLGKGAGSAILQNPDYTTLPVGYDCILLSANKKKA